MDIFTEKRVVVTGGTGSLGKALVRHLLSGQSGCPKKIIVFSRDEAKQHYMRVEYENLKSPTDEVTYNNFKRLLEFRIGDVRNYHSVCAALKGADIVVNAAALKQVPSCEYFPYEAVETNVGGAENILRAIRENELPIETVVGVSTDKACKPINVMGMSKALQERVFISSNLYVPKTRFICVRYGNVLASRGSVVPHFHEQIKVGGPVTITTEEMTRFLLPLEQAVETICAAIEGANPGETYVPKVKSTLITNVAKALIGNRKVEIVVTGIRPGEKVHEVMVSDEEAWRTVDRGDYFAIKPMLPELVWNEDEPAALKEEYSSANSLMDFDETLALLERYNLLLKDEKKEDLLHKLPRQTESLRW